MKSNGNFLLTPKRQRLFNALLARQGQSAASACADSIPARRSAAQSSPPLSFGQERLWFLDRLQPGSPAYIISEAHRLPGPANATLLEAAVGGILRRHDCLRARFIEHEGRPRQLIKPQQTVPLKVVDLIDCSAEEVDRRCTDVLREESAEPFDLEHGPLLRVVLMKRADGDLLAFSLHHIVSDAWSQRLFLRELLAHYNALTSGQPVDLPELTIQYGDFAQWQRDYLTGEKLQACVAPWRERLTGLPPLMALPTDHPRPRRQLPVGSRWQLLLPPELVAAARRLARDEGATLFMVLLAAFKATLYQWSGIGRIVVGTPVAGRNRSELEPLIGFFVNTLVLYTELTPGLSGRELLARVRETTLDAQTHQDVPFDKLVEELKPPRDPGYNPIFQVMFNLMNELANELPGPGHLPSDERGGVAFAPEEEESDALPGAPKFDFEMALTEHAAGITAILEYNTDLFDHDTMIGLGRRYRHVLTALVEQSDCTLADLPPFDVRARGSNVVVDTEADFNFDD